jgi:hypothetical protein
MENDSHFWKKHPSAEKFDLSGYVPAIRTQDQQWRGTSEMAFLNFCNRSIAMVRAPSGIEFYITN